MLVGGKDHPKALFRFILVRNHSGSWPGWEETMKDEPSAVHEKQHWNWRSHPGRRDSVTYIFNCQRRIPPGWKIIAVMCVFVSGRAGKNILMAAEVIVNHLLTRSTGRTSVWSCHCAC